MGETENHPAQWAIDLLTNNEGYKPQFYNEYFGQIFCGIVGFALPSAWNFYRRRPIFASFQHNIFSTAVGVGFGSVLEYFSDYYENKRDAVLVDYIKKYPERFPEPQNRKYAEIFIPWHPIR